MAEETRISSIFVQLYMDGLTGHYEQFFRVIRKQCQALDGSPLRSNNGTFCHPLSLISLVKA
ncbi:hypothetical protein KsCSTR_13150 [Candidatus Kuenenia stuttgartiensis]|uniref:Uncharacterized protein n=1 Tax=Kuenenia stuttgartiensis TaxID=174633 RepID=Q1Q0Y0_KUEST|nr:hypothetical protein KsCSTR_13150 [Candidatus Kuenenia stuttgartiensis]CAJ73659.1 unknown protein [Candidatus Kuenenia stuttgartiensis]